MSKPLIIAEFENVQQLYSVTVRQGNVMNSVILDVYLPSSKHRLVLIAKRSYSRTKTKPTKGNKSTTGTKRRI